ncbi:MAG: fatty acyl-AMP ligase [Herpetosiphonaceae bacterium]|nr:fatty acyl-AMP ligase [Herpetosiphonaceae bacterium]
MPDLLRQPTIASIQRSDIEADPRITTITAALRAVAEYPVNPENSHGVIVLDGRGGAKRLSYPELWSAARTVAAGLRQRGLKAGARVLLLLPTSEEYVVTLCGALLLGTMPCTVAAPTTRSKADEALRYLGYIYDKLDPALILVPEHLQATLQEHPGIDAHRVVTADDVRGEAPLATGALPMIRAEQPLHIQLTSGTTNKPKGVVLTHHNVIQNVQAIARAVDFVPSTDSGLSWLPLYHDMGFIQLLMAIYYQSSMVLMTPTSFLRDPLSWLHNIGRYRVSITAAPTFAYSLCLRKFDPGKLTGLDLGAWRRSFVGAEPVPLGILQQFTDTYRPYGLHDDTIYPSYGMAETVLITSGPTDLSHNPRHVFGFVACDRIDPELLRTQGRAVPSPNDDMSSPRSIEILGMGPPVKGLEIVVQDEQGQVVEDRVVGEICVRGTSLMQGYFQDAEATTLAVRDGYYHTGDRGYLVDGELYVLGRIKELIIVRGRNYQPFDIEAVIEEHEAVRKGYAVVFGVYNAEQGTDDMVAVIETKVAPEERPPMAQQIQQSLQTIFGFRAHEIIFVRHGTIPRTTSGKPQRVLSKEWYEQGKFKA